MVKQHSKNYEKFQSCIKQCVKNWNRTKLTDIEKWSIEQHMIWGIFQSALYILPLDDYQELKDWCLNEYGYNVGGAYSRKGTDEINSIK